MKYRVLFSISLLLFLKTFDAHCSNSLSLRKAKDPQLRGSLTIEFLQYIQSIFKPSHFLETGTLMGITTERSAAIFPNVLTFEIDRDFFNTAKNRLASLSNVQMYFGNSATLLDTVIPTLSGKALFWLDAHGPTVTVVIDELQCIKKHMVSNSIIMVDDIRIFQPATKTPHPELGNYPSVQEVIILLKEINPSYEIVIYGDILMAYPPSENIIVSPLLKALTKNRISNNYPPSELIMMEQIIANASDEEKEAINDLASWLYNSSSPIQALYYVFWSGLIAMQEHNYSKALSYFMYANQNDFSYPRLDDCIKMVQ